MMHDYLIKIKYLGMFIRGSVEHDNSNDSLISIIKSKCPDNIFYRLRPLSRLDKWVNSRGLLLYASVNISTKVSVHKIINFYCKKQHIYCEKSWMLKGNYRIQNILQNLHYRKYRYEIRLNDHHDPFKLDCVNMKIGI